MVSYLIRRILLMIPTLIGITIMVFLIARMAPGRPGQMQLGGEGVSAEEMKALAEWYDERLGADDPIWTQYINWWRGLVTRKVQAAGWLDGDQLTPLYTWRSPDAEYYVETASGSWAQLAPLSEDQLTTERTAESASIRSRLSSGSLSQLLPQLEDYADPRVVIIEADARGIESLAAVSEELLKPAEILVDGRARALAWTVSGDALHVNPASEETFLFLRDDRWMTFTPSVPPDRWTALAIDDQQLSPILKGQLDEQPQAKDGYALPRHVIATGSISPAGANFDEDSLPRLTVEVDVSIPTRLWLRTESDELAAVYEQVDSIPALLLQLDDGEWARLLGPTRIEVPEVRTVEQDDDFLGSLSAGDADDLRAIDDERSVPRHAIFAGTTETLGFTPTEREVRRFQYETKIFEITLGKSLVTHRPVIEELWGRIKITLMISLIAFPLIYLIAIPTGMTMAVKRGRRIDAGSNAILLAAWSIPIVLSATLLIGYAGEGGDGVQWFPNGGLSSVGAESWPFFDWLADRFWHLVLPVLCIIYGGIAYLAKQMRAAMLDNFTMDYVRTAKAKGVKGKDIVFRHVLRNSLLPIITIFATILPALIAGSIIIEKIFSIEGMGLLAFRSVLTRDYDTVQALALIAGALNLLGLLLADICYALADPRITYK